METPSEDPIICDSCSYEIKDDDKHLTLDRDDNGVRLRWYCPRCLELLGDRYFTNAQLAAERAAECVQ